MLAMPEVRERYERSGFEPVGNAPAEFGRQIREDLARCGRPVREANLEIEQRGDAVARSRGRARRPPRVAPSLRRDNRSIDTRG